VKTSIKILGTGCAKCKALESTVREVVSENDIEASIEKVEDMLEIISFEVMSTPALVINGKVVVAGSIPSKSQLLELLNRYRVGSDTI